MATKVLDTPMGPNDAGAKTIGDYLKALLSAVWDQDESFSGKRPFGNSGWRSEVYVALVKARTITGKLDSGGYLVECDEEVADEIIAQAIAGLQ